jgi:hypothetical protein
MLQYIQVEKGKPGESRGRKAMGLQPNMAMIARLPKRIIFLLTFKRTGTWHKDPVPFFMFLQFSFL